MKTTTGEIRAWATEELHKALTKVIYAKQSRRRPYYIMVIIKNGYDGPPAYGNNNELLHSGEKGETTIDLSGKRVVTQRLILLEQPPKVPMVNSSLWRVDNVKGEVYCVYILPPDRPMIQGFELKEESRIAFECGSKMPIIYN
jgi:hypothetical protein